VILRLNRRPAAKGQSKTAVQKSGDGGIFALRLGTHKARRKKSVKTRKLQHWRGGGKKTVNGRPGERKRQKSYIRMARGEGCGIRTEFCGDKNQLREKDTLWLRGGSSHSDVEK